MHHVQKWKRVLSDCKIKNTRCVPAIIALEGKTTFAFCRAKKRAIRHMQKTNQEHQISCLPDTYPQHQSQLTEIDIVARAKILKAHLEDVFAANFSVSVIPRKNTIIKIQHDVINQEQVRQIAQMYVDSDKYLILEKFHISEFVAKKK